MDRLSVTARLLGLAPCTSLVLASVLAAAEPTGGAFSWERQGPTLPSEQVRAAHPPQGPYSRNASAPSMPRYDEAYPSQRGAAPTHPSQPGVASAAPVAQAPRPVSPGLLAAARQADLHVKTGTDLGNRRAYFSARAEFIQAMRVMAQAMDVEHRTDGHTQALAAGLTALDESDDFIARGQTFESELNVARIAGVHRTPVVRSDAEGISPREALEHYYTYAQEQLATSMGSERSGSAALAALGKLYTVLAEEQPSELVAAQAKSMALHQAALVVDVNNPVAANELGVLLAKFGRPRDAQAWLQHSASLASHPATWHNLAAVHQQLGEAELAEQARRQEVAMAQHTGKRATSILPEIRWVSPQELNAAPADRPLPTAPPSNARPPAGQRSATTPAPAPSIARLPGIQSPTAASFE